MELFEVVKALFSKDQWSKVSRVEKDRYFFMINRFMSINYPRQASMFNLRQIPKVHVLDYWHRQLSKIYNQIPNWVYTKGQTSAKEEKEGNWKIDPELAKTFCERNRCSMEELNLLKTIAPEELKGELHELEMLLKSRKEKKQATKEPD